MPAVINFHVSALIIVFRNSQFISIDILCVLKNYDNWTWMVHSKTENHFRTVIDTPLVCDSLDKRFEKFWNFRKISFDDYYGDT